MVMVQGTQIYRALRNLNSSTGHTAKIEEPGTLHNCSTGHTAQLQSTHNNHQHPVRSPSYKALTTVPTCSCHQTINNINLFFNSKEKKKNLGI